MESVLAAREVLCHSLGLRVKWCAVENAEATTRTRFCSGSNGEVTLPFSDAITHRGECKPYIEMCLPHQFDDAERKYNDVIKALSMSLKY